MLKSIFKLVIRLPFGVALVMTPLDQTFAQPQSFSASEQGWTSMYYNSSGYMVSWGYYAINLAAAQKMGYTGKGVTVAVFDTGIAVDNPKFAGRILPGWNLFANGGAGAVGVTGDNGVHGTFVSGIIGASMTTTYPNLYGIAPNSKIMPMQIIDANGGVTGTDTQMAKAIDYATINGAKIYNNSWNSSYTAAEINNNGLITKIWLPSEIAAWQRAATNGNLIVFAAGNYSKKDPGFYATLPSLISGLSTNWVTVVAIDQTGALASYSNACGVAASYCMAAPGSSIISTYGSNTYGSGSGTSFAAPMVSGAAALMMEKWPSLKGSQIQSILFSTANKSGIYANTALYGQGMLDLTKAFAPIGTLIVAGTTGTSTAITGSGISQSTPFGDVVAKALGNINLMLLDDYRRDYAVQMGAGVGATAKVTQWGDQLAIFGADEFRDGTKVALSGSANGIRSSFRSSTAGSVTASVGSNMSPTLAFGPFAGGSIRGGDVVLLNSVGNPYLNMAPNGISFAMGYDWGDGHRTRIGAFNNTIPRDELNLNQNLAPQMSGSMVEHTISSSKNYASVSLGMVTENNSVLGMRSSGQFKFGSDANTALAGITGGMELWNKWSVFAGANVGYTMVTGTGDGLIKAVNNLTSGNGFAGITKEGVFGEGDHAGFILGLPLRTLDGTASLTVPDSQDANGIVSFKDYKVRLASNQLEWSAQAFYNTNLGSNQSLGFGIGTRLNALDSKGGSETIGMWTYRQRF